jgi:hypothetical protein
MVWILCLITTLLSQYLLRISSRNVLAVGTALLVGPVNNDQIIIVSRHVTSFLQGFEFSNILLCEVHHRRKRTLS